VHPPRFWGIVFYLGNLRHPIIKEDFFNYLLQNRFWTRLKKKIIMNENIKLIVTVDTEADNEWKNIKNLSTKNIAYLSKFQVLCQKYNIPPTYLVTYTVAQDKQAVNMLFKWQKDGVAEIGAHLHPWANPPFFEMDEYRSFPSELHSAIIKKKLEILTKTIEEKFKQKPTSYRAGRWGFGENQLKILKDLGYLVDCSVSPKVSWKKYIGKSGGEGGPDFRLYSVKPFFWSNGLLEVPMTIVFTGLLKQEDTKIATFFLKMKNGYIKKIINKLFFQSNSFMNNQRLHHIFNFLS